jgi:glycine/D-amino acid oxidase-like deaminating enzyme
MRARRPPCDDDACGWWNVLPSPPAVRHLAADVAADCVVVGAGLTGLAIARQLALHQPGWQIALVDGQRAGYGASGRNSGFAGAITHLDPTRGIEEALRLGRLCRAGIDALRSVVRERGIACDWAECGRIHAADDDRALRNLEDLFRILEAAGEAHQALDRRALARALGTDHYRAGVHIASTVLLQPAALARGLAGVLPENVTLYEVSPVRRIRRVGRWCVDAGKGTLRADRLFLALNGYAAGLGVLRRRVFPLLTFASLTRPLVPDELAQVGDREQWGLVAEDRMGTTLRRTPDGRILVRNGVRYAPSLRVAERSLARIQAEHRRSLRARWPGLEGVELEFSWGGVIGMTLNQGQFFGRLGPELYASLGYNGTGVAMGTASGVLLADYAVGADSALLCDALALPRPAWLPPQPFLGWGVRSAVAFLRRRAGAQR